MGLYLTFKSGCVVISLSNELVRATICPFITQDVIAHRPKECIYFVCRAMLDSLCSHTIPQ